MCNVKLLSALDNRQEEDSLFVYSIFCTWAFYCRCCTEHSVTSDSSSWAKHRILNQRGETVILRGEKGKSESLRDSFALFIL